MSKDLDNKLPREFFMTVAELAYADLIKRASGVKR